MRADEHAQQLIDQGYAVFERAYGGDDVDVFRRGLERLHAELGSPRCYAPTPIGLGPCVQLAQNGLVIAKLVERRPDFADRILKAPIVDAIRLVLGPGMRLELTAAVLADETRPSFPWHTHIGGQDDTTYKHLGEWPAVERMCRVGTLLYLDHLGDESGPLVLYPRAAGTSTAPPHDPERPSWPGEVVVRVPPGSLVVMDECTWHTARPKTTPGLRLVVGCNFAAAHTRPSSRSRCGRNRAAARCFVPSSGSEREAPSSLLPTRASPVAGLPATQPIDLAPCTARRER